MTSLALRLYTVAIALICGAAIAFTINQQHQSSTWQSEAQSWKQLAARTVHRNRTATRKMRLLMRRYNRLVVDTRRSQQRLLSSMQGGSTSSGTVYRSSTVYSSSGGGGSAAPAPAPVPAPVSSPPPVTKTS